MKKWVYIVGTALFMALVANVLPNVPVIGPLWSLFVIAPLAAWLQGALGVPASTGHSLAMLVMTVMLMFSGSIIGAEEHSKTLATNPGTEKARPQLPTTTTDRSTDKPVAADPVTEVGISPGEAEPAIEASHKAEKGEGEPVSAVAVPGIPPLISDSRAARRGPPGRLQDHPGAHDPVDPALHPRRVGRAQRPAQQRRCV